MEKKRWMSEKQGFDEEKGCCLLAFVLLCCTHSLSRLSLTRRLFVFAFLLWGHVFEEALIGC